MRSIEFASSEKYDGNMQIGFELTPDENASTVPLRYLFHVCLSVSVRITVNKGGYTTNRCGYRWTGAAYYEKLLALSLSL